MTISPLVEASELSVCGYSGRRVLDEISLTISCGDRVALVGPNGAGKTTFAKVVAGLVAGYSGSLRLNGEREGKNYSHRELSRLVSYVPQRVEALPRFSVDQFLELSQAGRVCSSVPVFVQSLLQQQLPDLSGGELQKVLIAGAVVQGAQLLVLDEPTASLDPKGRKEVEDILSQLSCGEVRPAQLLITHDISLAVRCCQRVVILKNGRIVWQGAADHDALLVQLEVAYECRFRCLESPDGKESLVVPV